ncbi:DNA polymerase III subunit alpha [Candidatus Gottesmanbacteria bacterium]|nr:DNA polymerase III subunit alpha [Candidatus Gottesmanbacteria bacterium]
MSDFVHLHCHSEYSLLDGLSKIPDLLVRTKELGMDSLALTDHGAMYGAIEFYTKAEDAGIKPIIGMEAYQAARSRFDKEAGQDRDQYHLVLLAKNKTGYHNLIKLTTLSHLEGFYYKPRIDMDLLREYKDGLIALSGCMNGLIPSLLRDNQIDSAEKKALEFLEIFGKDHYYFEIQKHSKIPELDKINDQLITLSRKLGIPLVATNDAHYLTPEDVEAQEILLCIGTQRTILEKNRPLSMISSPDFYLRSAEEMKGLFLKHPEAIENTKKIAELCNLEIDLGNWKKLAFDGGKMRFGKITDEIKQRLDYELEIIAHKGYSTYFLVVADFVNWAKEKGIAVGPGRGSAAGSLVAYCMRITDLDPLFHELPFERFLNPNRPSPPDIDLDFADNRRDEVIEYVTHKYGQDKVAQIITFGTMEARQAVRDVGRALGMPYAQPDRIAKLIPIGAQGFPMTIEKALELSPELSYAYQHEADTKRLIDLARKLEGVARHASVHAAGVVIADKPLTQYVPLQKETKGDRVITQYDMYCLDLNAAGGGKAVGLLKMDLLGLRNLSILEKAVKFVKDSRGVEVDFHSIPLDEKKAYEIIASGETTGIFQLESPGMRRLAKDLKPTKFTDISAMVALFRPGPMDWIPIFIEAKQNLKKIKYPHEALKPILSETYGIAVYQEQCMQIAHVMAGYSLVEADKLRMAIGKKKPEVMKKEKEKFISGCIKQGYSKSVAENVFSLIEKFAGYGFNKAHSASYGMIAYQTAYMKAKYPIEFMCAVLAAESHGSGPARDEKVAQAVMECKRNNIPLLPPDINNSDSDFTIENLPARPAGGPAGRQGEKIRFGLSAVKNVGTAAIDSILSARIKGGLFVSLTDFISRVDLQKVNKKTLESLIKAGCLDRFGKRASLLAAIPQFVEIAHKRQKEYESGQASLFSDEETSTVIDVLPELDEFSQEELLLFEKQLLGFYLTNHPLVSYFEILDKKVTHKISELTKSPSPVIIGGFIAQVKKIVTRNGGSEMAFVRLEDSSGSIELVVFPSTYERTKEYWIADRIVLVKGKVNERDDRVSVIVDAVKSLELEKA